MQGRAINSKSAPDKCKGALPKRTLMSSVAGNWEIGTPTRAASFKGAKMNFNPFFGFETEYGITIEGGDASDLIKASREVVKAYGSLGLPYASPWNYRSEDPRNDQRGFHVEHLTVDTVDAQFDRPGERAASPQEDRCDHVLRNGARLYNDHGHPEYATPECGDLRSLVAHDKAGERIVLQCAQTYGERVGKLVEIWKNNTDFHGASYGSHESYLIQRGVFLGRGHAQSGAVFGDAYYILRRGQSRVGRARNFL